MPADLAPEVALQGLEPGFLAVGEGAVVYADLVITAGGRLVEAADDPGVDALVALGADALARGHGQDPIAVRPTYLRPPDAKPRSVR